MSTGAVQIGSDRQLFLDDMWFDNQENIRLRMHTPEAREVALTADQPWESGGVHYSTVIEDEGRFRMWYRCDIGAGRENRDGESMMCYAESTDGINWDKPNLGLVDWAGSRDNNLILPTDDLHGINASVIKDPNGAPGEKYKMITREKTKPIDAILGFVSDDGIHWTRTGPDPILTGRPFDSHNILLWDEASEKYVIYMRGHSTSVGGTFGPTEDGHRSIRRSESTDFLNWSEPETVIESDDDDPPGLHFYTNSGLKYGRAANAYLMFPMILYPERVHPSAPIPGLSDIQMATSRDGITWERRFREPYIRPGLDLRNWVDRNPIMGPGILELAPGELSMYYVELYREGPDARFRRCTIRTDGFVSVEGPYKGWGEFVTPPLTFTGDQLELNYSTAGGGSIFVEIQTEDGTPIDGLSLDDCNEVFGDKIEGVVAWKDGAALGAHAGNPVRLRIKLRDANLYAFRFGNGEGTK